ncbi:MAG: LacI family transcriptional regulator [Clostridia bacterium]|nr:LacI family transcriptional regulator [Clostridia bacterium]
MSSRKDVAREAGVSETTVTNILNRMKPATKEVEARVFAAAKKLNYRPNVIAQGLRTKNSRQIGVFISEIGNPYFAEMLHGIEIAAAAAGYVITIILLSDNIEKKYCDIMSRGFTGIINISNIPYTDPIMMELFHSGIALVNFDREHGSIVYHDMAPGMRTLMRKAYELGHRKAAYIVGYSSDAAELDPRVIAYCEESERLGFEKHKDMLVYGDFPRRNSTTLGYEGAMRVFSQNNDISVLFCINDIGALGAIRALNELHIRVPDEVSVVGCDNINMSEFFTPPLTTIETFCYERGTEMVKALVRRIEGGAPEYILLLCEAVMRESLVPPKKRAPRA